MPERPKASSGQHRTRQNGRNGRTVANAAKSPADERAVLLAALNRQSTEKEFQAAVVRYARARGHLVYHTHDSRKSEPGFPDLVIVNRTDYTLHFLELKTETGRVSPAQERWLTELSACRHLDVRLVRPRDYDALRVILA